MLKMSVSECLYGNLTHQLLADQSFLLCVLCCIEATHTFFMNRSIINFITHTINHILKKNCMFSTNSYGVAALINYNYSR